MTTISLRTTLATGAVILALWGANWALRGADLGAWSIVLAVGIASIQVILGALVFMELASASSSVVLSFLTCIGMFGLLLGFMVADVVTRAPPPQSPPRPAYPAELPRARG